MFDRFTPSARKVLNLSRIEAQKLRNDYIGTEHILMGLIADGNGVAAQVLMNLNLDLRRVRAEVETLVEKGSKPVTGDQLPFTPRAKRVLEHALEEASDLGQKLIGTEHLLLGLIRELDGPAAHVLQNLGVDPWQVRLETIDLVGAGPPTAGDEEARALVEAILLKRLRHAEPRPDVPGTVELEVRSVHGPKGWGFQLWLGHRVQDIGIRTEMAFWVDRAPVLEEHFVAVLDLFVRLVRSESTPPASPSAK